MNCIAAAQAGVDARNTDQPALFRGVEYALTA